MAILNYGNQFKYSGKGYIDSKMLPVGSVDELETNVSVLSANYMPGMKVTVLNDGEYGAMEYFLNEDYEWKRVINLDSLTLSFDKGNYDGEPDTEYYLQIHYTNARGELVALGEALDLSVLLEDVEARIEALENQSGDVPSVEDTNTFVENATLVTEKDGENGIFIKFDYNDGNSFYLDVTSLEPKTYANGVGILIGEDNVVSIDEEWFDEWFDAKIEELIGKLSALEGEVSEVKENVASLSDMINTLSGRVDGHDAEIKDVKDNLASALTQIAENKTEIVNVKADVEENKANIISLAEQLAKIRGVEFVKGGDNVTITTNEDGSITVSATVPEADLTEVENRLDAVEGTVASHTSDILSLQEAIKNANPEGTGLSGDNVTIKANENGALSVMISAQEDNVIKKNNDGIFVQGIEIVLGDDEINGEENN